MHETQEKPENSYPQNGQADHAKPPRLSTFPWWIIAGILLAAIALGITAKLTGLSIIFLIQTVVVFLIPFLFGWIVLRTILQEGNLLLLIPGSIIIGCGALMLTVNELRFFLPFGKSLWFSYKLLVLVAVILLLAVKTPKRKSTLYIPETFRQWYKLALIGATAVVLATYFGVPAFQGVLNDGWWFHYPNAIAIQTIETFPPRQPFSPDSSGLYYHYGPGILAASWSFLLDQSVRIGYALNIIIFAPTAFLMAIALVNQVTQKFAPAYWAGVLLLVAGNLRFLFLLGGVNSPAEALSTLNGQTVEGLIEMIFTPSHCAGIPFTLLLLIVFTRFITSPSWSRGILFGLFLGVMTMIGAWYFALAFAACFILALLPHHQQTWGRLANRLSTRQRWLLILTPFAIAIFVGMFNNSYLAGYLRPYWFQDGSETIIYSRIAESLAEQQMSQEALSQNNEDEDTGAIPNRANDDIDPAFPGINVPEIDLDQVFATYAPRIIQPNLTPIVLNTENFGFVPTMEGAGSTGENWVRLLGAQVIAESFPIFILGIPFSILLCYRQRKHKQLLFLLSSISVLAIMPPIFLKWGYRPIEFLRFFTVSFTLMSLTTGWFIGELWTVKSVKYKATKILAVGLLGLCLINPILLGIIGLMPGTVDAVSEVTATAQSLSDVTAEAQSETSSTLEERQSDQAVFDQLAIDAGKLLFSRTQGQERMLVIVPPNELLPQEHFPAWLRLATLTKMIIPTGPYYNRSIYGVLYEDANNHLSQEAISGLDIQWIYLSSQYIDEIPPEVVETLENDRRRFFPYSVFSKQDEWVKLYRVQS